MPVDRGSGRLRGQHRQRDLVAEAAPAFAQPCAELVAGGMERVQVCHALPGVLEHCAGLPMQLLMVAMQCLQPVRRDAAVGQEVQPATEAAAVAAQVRRLDGRAVDAGHDVADRTADLRLGEAQGQQPAPQRGASEPARIGLPGSDPVAQHVARHRPCQRIALQQRAAELQQYLGLFPGLDAFGRRRPVRGRGSARGCRR
jgi:hypothetical protein